MEALAQHITVAAACKAVGAGRATAYDERHRNEAFALQWAEVEEATVERLEQEAFRRAVEGVERVVYHAGKKIGTERYYSDNLLMFLVKAKRPSVYRDNVQVEHSGKVKGEVVYSRVVAVVPDEQHRLEIAQILASALGVSDNS